MQENYPTLISVKKLKAEFEAFQKIQITSEEFSIGRGLDNSAVITYLAISRKHCTFKKLQYNEWAIEDHSSFGIEINNEKLKKGVQTKLSNDDVIKLDATGDFMYKFQDQDDGDFVPRKRVKLDDHSDIISNVKMKFDESQNFEMKHIEDKIQNAKQMQTTSIILKQQLELDMARKIKALESEFAVQIESLRGEKTVVEEQKALLEEERDLQLSAIRQQMEQKIADLMEQIQKHTETESELMQENAQLKEKLTKEREDFLAELQKESTSKQDLLQQLEARVKEQEEMRLAEKQELELLLKAETEQLRLAKEKELQELEEEKKKREQELQLELQGLRSDLERQAAHAEEERARLQAELDTRSQQMMRASEEEKSRVEQLLLEKEKTANKFAEAQENANKSLMELRQRVSVRETELAAVAAARIQQHADQSGEAISALQGQLESVRSQLLSVESEKNSLLQSIGAAPAQSKAAALAEVGELLESELQCSICAELFMQATTLGCAHTFCRYCIAVWKKKKRECPICRAAIVSECKSLVLDSFIEKMVSSLNDEMKEKRETMLKDREEMDAKLVTENAGTSRRRSDSDDDDSDLDDELEEEEEDDYYDDYAYSYRRRGRYYYSRRRASSDDTSGSGSGADAAEDGHAAAPAAGVPGAAAGHDAGGRGRRAGVYYGGYGRCFRCGERGHWAPGCPH